MAALSTSFGNSRIIVVDEEEDEARTSPLMESHHILPNSFLHNYQTHTLQTQIPNNHGDAQFSGRKPGDGQREAADEEGEKREQARKQLEGGGGDEAHQEAEEAPRVVDGGAQFG